MPGPNCSISERVCSFLRNGLIFLQELFQMYLAACLGRVKLIQGQKSVEFLLRKNPYSASYFFYFPMLLPHPYTHRHTAYTQHIYKNLLLLLSTPVSFLLHSIDFVSWGWVLTRFFILLGVFISRFSQVGFLF